MAEHDVIVIGAGMAGLSCASALRSKGADVIVLEAQNRIGGRVRSVPVSIGDNETFMVDLGASWIHGTENNPVADLSKKLNMHSNETTEGLNKPVSLAAFDGTGALPAVRMNLVQQIYLDSTLVACKKIDQLEGSGEEDRCMAVEMQQLFLGHASYASLNASERHLLGYFRARDEEFVAIGFDKASFLQYNEDEDPPGPQVAVEHMAQLTDHLASKVDVRINHPVAKIELLNKAQGDRQRNVRITTESGASFSATAVVLAVPVALLQSHQPNHIDIQPPLPQPQQKSINSIGFGTLNKVCLVFEKAFWDESEAIPEHARNKEYLTWIPFFDDPAVTLAENGGLPVHFVNVNRMLGKPVLNAMIYGKSGEDMEHKTDDELREHMMSILSAMYSPYVAASDMKLKQIVVTRWHSNPYARGSYSTMPLGCTGDDMDRASAPVFNAEGKPVIGFAGEHTLRENYGTTRAAFLSGAREAERLLQHVPSLAGVLRNRTQSAWV